MKLKRTLYENGLSLAVLVLFILFMGLQMAAGFGSYNEEQQLHDEPTATFFEYMTRPYFWAALFENWESEFLQMGLLIVLSEKLRQKGSAQSRKLKKDKAEEEKRKNEIEAKAAREGKTPGPVKAGGWRLKLYSNSLLLVFLVLFVFCFIGHFTTSYLDNRDSEITHGFPVSSVWKFFTSGEFWFESMQNWQSEFLAVFSIVVLSIWLRAKDSTESKPVGAAHDYTGH